MKNIGSLVFKYFLGIFSVVLAIGMGELLAPYLPGHYLFLLIIAVILSSLYGGFGVGITSTVMATLACNYFFQWPRYTFAVTNYHDWMELGFFLVIAILMSWIGASTRLARKRAEDASRSREEVIAMVSHDLKNPLTAIQLNADLILRMKIDDPKEEKIRGQVLKIRNATGRMNGLIHEILDYEKIKRGTFTVDVNDEKVRGIAGDIGVLIEPLAREKSLEFTTEMDGEDFSIACDREKILQVLSNLLGNAVKFTSAGGKVKLIVEKNGSQAVFKVEDTGSGIPKESFNHIFDRYWQAKETASLGTGLGLSIVKGIVEAHHGKINVESKVGVGTSFSFTVPLASH